MRHRFEQQISLGSVAIADIEFPLKCRDELPPVLKALQYIFITPELNEKVFGLLEKKICSTKKKTGRNGMDLWHILVLAVARHALSTNWDRLEYLANYDQLMRKVMGVDSTTFNEKGVVFGYQSILDNVRLVDETLLQQINLLVVEAGRQLLTKKVPQPLKLKTDSYVLETNVHFPTDLNLLWDAGRKCLDIIEQLRDLTGIKGWRKIKHIRKTLKSCFRSTSHQVFKGKNETRKKQSVTEYLQQVRVLEERSEELIKSISAMGINEVKIAILITMLEKFKGYVNKLADLTERRLIKGETIPAEEKIYSIFEEHTEWITKGKLNKKVELGHMLLITTDQHNFIVDYKVMEKQRDAAQVASLTERIKENFPSTAIYSQSFDKGFFSKENFETLQNAGIQEVVLPKKGRLNKEEKERESQPTFKKLRHAHSAIESNINMLEHHGLNRCVDKGLHGYKRYVGLSVLAYNLHILGNHLVKNELEQEEKRRKKKPQRLRTAA